MLIRRSLFSEIQKTLSGHEITLITGPRQSGKTTLMEMLRDKLEKKGEKTVFFNLDFESDRPFFQSQERLLQRISYTPGKNGGYIFIDEIQRKVDAGLFLKGLYDMKLPYKFIVSGSGSIELKEKIHESLPGRKRLFELSTLSFAEFAGFKTNYANLSEYFDLYPEKASRYLEEYLNFGGYPKVVLSPGLNEKQVVIADIYQSFLEKDIALLLNIRKTENLTNLVKILACQIGNLVNVAELSATLNLSAQTVKEYLWYLEKTFIVNKITPYFKNIRKEITKAPTYYFTDLGLRNYSTGQFGTAATFPGGFLFENFIYRLLKNNLQLTPSTIHFWRTRDGAEVDFVINTGSKVIPVEVKYSYLKSPEISRSFRSFITKYQPPEAYLVHLGPRFTAYIGSTRVNFVPFFYPLITSAISGTQENTSLPNIYTTPPSDSDSQKLNTPAIFSK